MANSLSKYFTGVTAKRLKLVEIKPKGKSNQHEINGTVAVRNFLGEARTSFNGKFIYLSDDEDDAVYNEISFTWYDSRENVDHRGPEHRLYYQTNDAINSAEVGDLIIIGKTLTNELIAIIAKQDSTAEKQLLWLFDLQEVKNKFIVKDLSHETTELGFSAKYIISSLGFETEVVRTDLIEELLKVFKGIFPSTKEFSKYARSTVTGVSPVEEPDKTLVAWMEREMLFFKAIESIQVKKQLGDGFGADGLDVDLFISYSLGVQNRRKARAGAAFENNLATIFSENQIRYSNGKVSERNNKPDFIFPSIEDYHNVNFNVGLLSMLGLKTTAKDRWRQILPEADKIPNKNLITLEPSISKNQTNEMIARNVQLVIPTPIIPTYTADQQKNIISLSDFIKHVASKQAMI
ncbi:type II restriction endonuclease [Mucilaginibacter sp.]|jgi:hypothetical protein|uniref:type II restriction endonuclease n=1 Tax=Mucilaginibacter sp. TaxID=1882438 RepID=UPI002BC7EBC0|nr:type II restriction endonuclease [Mucilaginibacter sp.]HTI60501.1 type II restriction endonuclease [Mucilaginibacter sp.]